MFKVKLTLEKNKYNDYIKSIEPEIEETFGRSKVYIENDSKNIYIIIKAPDTSSLRASVSSITRVLSVVKKIMEVNVW